MGHHIHGYLINKAKSLAYAFKSSQENRHSDPSLSSGKLHPPFCSIYDMPLCCQQQEPSIIPDLVTQPLQWPSFCCPLKSCLYACLTMLSLHTANMPKPPESSVSDDICDRFRGKGDLSDFDHLLSVLPGNPLIACRLCISKTYVIVKIIIIPTHLLMGVCHNF